MKLSPGTCRLGGRVRGFTLLELLVSVTILASVFALLATLWSQTTAWSGENSKTLKTMRLPRVTELLRSQWADRRGSFQLASSGASVIASPDRLSFVTASPILFPDWPIVRAEYIIERDYDTPVGTPPAWRLVYEETRLSELTKPPEEVEELRAKGLDDQVGRYVLLAGLSHLDFERFGTGERSALRSGSAVEEVDEDAPELSAGVVVEVDRDEDEVRWRPFVGEFRGLIPAVRLSGAYEGEAFSCVFVITGLR